MKPVMEKAEVEGSVIIREGGFTVKTMHTPVEMVQAYHLRHRIFSEELKWVPPSENGLEVDEYDKEAVSFGVFDGNNRLMAFLRLILPPETFMLEKIFLFLVAPEHPIRREGDTAEISRLCVAPEARSETISGNFGVHSLTLLLLKGVYHWCLKNNVRYFYAVTERKVQKLFSSKGFPFRPIGEPQAMPDGVVAMASMMDWQEFEAINEDKRPALLRWFTQELSVPVPGQRQQHESYLRHSASA